MSETKGVVAIIEDNEDLGKCWAKMLSLRGYQHLVYRNGEEALSDLENLKSCDIVFTDYYLPDINGIELGKRLREKIDVPLVLLTGSREESLLDELDEIDNFTILHKPLRFKNLEERIKLLCVE